MKKKALLIVGMLAAGQSLAGPEELLQLAPQIMNLVSGQQQAKATEYPTESQTVIKAPKSKGYTPAAGNALEKLFASVDRCRADAFYERHTGKAPTVPGFLRNQSPRLENGQAVYNGQWDFHGLKVSEIRLFVIPDAPTATYGLTFDADQATVQQTLAKAYKKKWEASAKWGDGFGGTVTRTLQGQGGKTSLTCIVPPAGD